MTIKRAGVLGHPVSHSLSPILHEAAYAALGLADWQYGRHDVTVDGYRDFIRSLDDSWAGLSITMPLKQVSLLCCDHVDPLAEVVGATNTVLRGKGGLLTGTNTDVYGIVHSLREVAPSGWAPTQAVILGAGATACSALAALGELGITTPTVVARSLQRAGAVRRAESRMGVTVDYVALADAAVPDVIAAADIVISTLPAGAGDQLIPILEDQRRGQSQVLLDVIYDGWPTALASAWVETGGRVAAGQLMLLHQACEQVRLMTGQQAPVAQMRAALADALA